MLVLPRAVPAPPTARRHRQRPRPRPSIARGQEHYNPPQRQPRTPVLAGSYPSAGVVAVDRYREDGRDWRKLSPTEVIRQFLACGLPPYRISKGGLASKGDGSLAAAAAAPASQRREGLMAALAAGVLQATDQGSYWTPGFGLLETVECHHLRQPVSRLVPPARQESERPTDNMQVPALRSHAGHSALSLCLEFAMAHNTSRTALVKFGAEEVVPGLGGDFRSLELREAELLYRSNYLWALLDLEKHVYMDVNAALKEGYLIHTFDVSILRGPVEDGAPWFAEAPAVDVIWVPLPRSVYFQEDGFRFQGYQDEEERAIVATQLRRAISTAAMVGIQNLVVTPPGAGQHPAVEVAELLREAALACGHGIHNVVLCREFEDQMHGRWTDMSAAFEHGVERIKVPHWDEVRRAALSRLHMDKFKPGYEATLRRYLENPTGYLRRIGKFPPPPTNVCDEKRLQTSPATVR